MFVLEYITKKISPVVRESREVEISRRERIRFVNKAETSLLNIRE